MIPIFESRRLAYHELDAEFDKFVAPDIASALEFPSYLIVIARITAVQQPNGSSMPRTRVSLDRLHPGGESEKQMKRYLLQFERNVRACARSESDQFAFGKVRLQNFRIGPFDVPAVFERNDYVISCRHWT